MRKLLMLMALVGLPFIAPSAQAYTCPAPFDSYDCANYSFPTGNASGLSTVQIDLGGGAYAYRLNPTTLASQYPECWQNGYADSECLAAATFDVLKVKAEGMAYEGTTQRLSPRLIYKTATVSSGTAVFHLTDTGLSGGTALCTGVIKSSVNTTVNDATASYQYGWAWSNSDKTLTVTTNKLTTANILTGVLGQSAANGSTVNLTVACY